MKKIWPILLVVLLATITVLWVQLYTKDKALNSEFELRNENYAKYTELSDKYQDEDRKLLEETIKEVMILEWKQDNHRKSIDNLRSKIKIKEDWMDNPQKKWKVNASWEVVDVDLPVILEWTEAWE